MPDETTTAEPVDLNTARLVAATEGAGVSETRTGRTGEEKVEALDAATEATGNVDPSKTLYELAAGSKDELAAAVQGLLYLCERALNIDFIREATLAEVLSGAAHQRAAMSGNRESPQQVDDRVIPPGVNNPTDEITPPNIPTGDKIPGTDRVGGVGDSGPAAPAVDPDATPAKSATREEWDAYASKAGLDPSQYSSKEELQAAIDEQTAQSQA